MQRRQMLAAATSKYSHGEGRINKSTTKTSGINHTNGSSKLDNTDEYCRFSPLTTKHPHDNSKSLQNKN